MQANDSLKKKQADAFEKVETWTLQQYYFNMLQYALKKEIALPFIDFTLNGKLLFRLAIDEQICDASENGEEKSCDSSQDEDVQLEFVLKYYGSQHSFVKRRENEKIEYYSLSTQDATKIAPCNIKGFQLVFEDENTPSSLCFGKSFDNISQENLAQALDCVLQNFKLLQKMEETHVFDLLDESSVERLFTEAAHDNAAVAYELQEDEKIDAKGLSERDAKELNERDAKGLSEQDAKVLNERELSLQEEWRIAEQKSQALAKLIEKKSIVSSCELHADIWQRNEKIKMTCIGRQYENLAVLPRISDAMHVKFRGADEQLQKKILVAELLVELLPTLVMSIF